MGLDYDSGKRLGIKNDRDNIKITSMENKSCDNPQSFSIDELFNLLIPENVPDISIDTSRITVLELSLCDLTDLPESFKTPNLKYLDLSRNNLKNVPLCLYTGLKHLEFLDLSHNTIQHFDLEPECLPVVKVIRLNDNSFENIPKWFLMFRGTNLEEFNYSHNKAKHYKYLRNSFNMNLLKLKKLELKSSCLLDTDYDFLKCFKSLRYLDIGNEKVAFLNKFQEVDELFVKPKWKELHVLRLDALALSLFPDGVAWIETLRELYLTNNNISWLPDDVQYLVNLEILDISHNEIIAIPNNLVSLENLSILHAAYNSIESVPDFALMCNMKTLDLYNNLLDMISFDINGLDFVDVEDNYYDTKYFEDSSMYENKKDCLRNKYSYLRYDGPKERKESVSSRSRSDSEDTYSQSTSAYQVFFDETENWDLPVEERTRNPEIDSIDAEWQGEDRKFDLEDFSKRNRVYVSDEDWMFVDFEES